MTDLTSDQLFRLLIVATLAVNVAISGYFRRQAHKKGGQLDPSGDRVLLLLRLSALIVLLPLFAFLINVDWMGWARYDLPGWLRWAGFILSAGSTPVLFWLFATIGKNISPSHTTRDEHELVTDGPYRFIRHPLYTFGFLIFFGVGLMASMWWVLGALVILVIVVDRRTKLEEQHLIAQFGDEYKTYMTKTGRYLPKIF